MLCLLPMVINIYKNYKKCHVAITNIYTAEEGMLLSKWYKKFGMVLVSGHVGVQEWLWLVGFEYTIWLIAQLVERWACNPEVAGSNRLSPNFSCSLKNTYPRRINIYI